MNKKIAQLAYKLVEDIVGQFDYFQTQPKHLAWAMMQVELVTRAAKEYTQNVRESADFKNDKDSKLYNAAWCMIYNPQGDWFNDTNPTLPLEEKLNKTMDEWIELYSNPGFRFHELAPTPFRVKEKLLSTQGAEYQWNETGYIAKIIGGVDIALFAGYTRVEHEIPQNIKDKFLNISSDPSINAAIQKSIQKAKQKIPARQKSLPNDEQNPPQSSQREKKSTKTPIRSSNEDIPYASMLYKSSNLLTMPDNVHVSYISAGIQVAQATVDLSTEIEYKRLAQRFLEKWS